MNNCLAMVDRPLADRKVEQGNMKNLNDIMIITSLWEIINNKPGRVKTGFVDKSILKSAFDLNDILLVIFVFYNDISNASFAIWVFSIALSFKEGYYFNLFIALCLEHRRNKAFYNVIVALIFKKKFDS